MKREALGVALLLLCAAGAMALLQGRSILGAVVWLVAYAAVVALTARAARRQRTLARRLGTYVTVRSVLVFGLAAPLVQQPVWTTWPAWGALLLVVAVIRCEPRLGRSLRRHGVRTANLPGLQTPAALSGPATVLFLCQLAVLPALLVLGLVDAAPVFWLLLVLPSVGATVWAATVGLTRRWQIGNARTVLTTVLEAYRPRFAVYWDAPPGSGYQLAMWLPYLRRVGEPFVVLVRNPAGFNEAAALVDDVPVVLTRTLADVERCVVPTLRAAFYVNNAARNSHLVRFAALTHVQLLHGDSDKAPSYNPVTAMFDRIFVAGQAGIDRYGAHGVDIPRERFAIVGRPQVESIELVDTTADRVPTTVLYAPTWRGQHTDAAYSSLEHGPALIEMLLARGCAVVFRPHPYSRRDAGHRALIEQIHERLASDTGPARSEHLFGPDATDISVNDCFNRCDAMIADVSSVVVDFLQSEKPMATTYGDRDPATFTEEFPVAAATYLLGADPETWPGVIDTMLGDDPMAADRARLRKYYLGDLPREGYAEVFVSAARAVVTAAPVAATDVDTASDSDPAMIDEASAPDVNADPVMNGDAALSAEETVD